MEKPNEKCFFILFQEMHVVEDKRGNAELGLSQVSSSSFIVYCNLRNISQGLAS